MQKKKPKQRRGVRTIPTRNSLGIHPMFFVPENVAEKVIGNRPLTAEELYKLKAPISISYIAMCEGRANPTDWYNVTFRIRTGMLMGEHVYHEDVIAELSHGYQIMESVRKRSEDQEPSKNNWNFLPDEIPVILSCIEAVDQIQLEVDRAVQLDAYKRTMEFLEVFRDTSHEQRKSA